MSILRTAVARIVAGMPLSRALAIALAMGAMLFAFAPEQAMAQQACTVAFGSAHGSASGTCVAGGQTVSFTCSGNGTNETCNSSNGFTSICTVGPVVTTCTEQGPGISNCTATVNNTTGAFTFTPGCIASTPASLQTAGVTAVQASRVGVAAVQSHLTTIRDQLQRRRSMVSGPPLGYAEESETSSAALGYASSSAKSALAKGMPILKAPAKPPEPAFNVAAWAQGFGDYENRTGQFNGADIGRIAGTSGVVGGLDLTLPHLFRPTDAWVIGLLGGDTESTVHNADGSSAHLRGPGVGVYSVYVNGGFSTDSLFKADLFDLDSTDAFNNTTGLHLTNYTTADNLNYKFELGQSWIEPTAGFTYTATNWDNASLAIGLTNGQSWRVQGGARIGTAFDANGVHVEPSLTALLYDDVSITGGTIVTATSVVPTDQGKVFGQLDGKLNFEFARGFSSFVEGEVRGRENVFGVAGRVGIRYVFNTPD
jgi:hypothetical protein